MDGMQSRTISSATANADKKIKIEKNIQHNKAQARKYAPKSRKTKYVILLRCGTMALGTIDETIYEPGRQLQLVREPDNKEDRWSTRVCTMSGEMLGYLPTWKNQSVARLMDAGKTITAFVDEESLVGKPGYSNRFHEDGRLPLIVYMEIPVNEEDKR